MSDSRLSTILVAVMLFVTLVIYAFRGLMVDKSEAVRALDTQGYSNIQITDEKWFVVGLRGCESTDAVRFDVTAVNPVGKKVNLFVCVGWPFKGSTIRSE